VFWIEALPSEDDMVPEPHPTQGGLVMVINQRGIAGFERCLRRPPLTSCNPSRVMPSALCAMAAVPRLVACAVMAARSVG
jgi:hypothetical protein